MSKKLKIVRPNRDPDHYSKRGVPYWWAPEWIRGTSADSIVNHEDMRKDPQSYMGPGDILLTTGAVCTPCSGYGKIRALREKNGEVNLHMKSQATGKFSYIQGSIQQE